MKLVTARKPTEPEEQKDLGPTPLPDTRQQTAQDLRRTRARRLLVKLGVGVVLPTVLAAVYYGAVASKQYESVATFTVQSADGNAVSSLELLIATVPGNSAARDTLLMQNYVRSRDMLTLLSDEHGFVEHYSSSDVDWWSRLAPDAPFEDRYEYYHDKVTVDFDNHSGAVTLKVRAFSAEKARELAVAIMGASDRMVNQMMQTARSDRIALAQREVDEAEQRLTAARAAVLEVQRERSELDPAESAAAIISVRSSIETQLAEAEAELASLRATLQPGVPQLAEAQQRVSALRRQVERQNRRLTGRDDEGLNTAIAAFEPAIAEKEFAEREYATALQSLEVARIEADRQHRYLVTISEPSRPDTATHPNVWVSVLTVFLLALGILGIGSLLLASIREHANL